MTDDTFIIDEAKAFPIKVGMPYQIPDTQSPWEQDPSEIRPQTFDTPLKSDPSGLSRSTDGPYGVVGEAEVKTTTGPTGSMVIDGNVVGDRVWIDVINGGEYVVRHIGPGETCYSSQSCPTCPVVSKCHTVAWLEVDEAGHVTLIGVGDTCISPCAVVCLCPITP